MSDLDITNLFPVFESKGIPKKELEDLLKEIVAREHPMDPIKSFSYTEDGVEIILDSGEAIDVDIDWNEFILE